jgi:hypothetical protein
LFDYSKVSAKDLDQVKKSFNAPKHSADKSRPVLTSACHQYRVWNVERERGYKGHLIIEKATENSASSSTARDKSEEEESEEEEMAAAMAAVRVE